MGALVSMQAAVLAPERIRRLVAIDTVGPMDLLAMPSVATASLRLLPLAYPSAGTYCAGMHAMGILEPWEDLWKRAFAYELEGFHGLVRPRTSFRAVAEDLVYNLLHTGTSLWPRLRLPTILVRATRRLPPFGFAVGARLRDAFLRTAPSVELAEVDANHFEIMAHPDALRAIAEFLVRPAVALPDSPARPRQPMSGVESQSRPDAGDLPLIAESAPRDSFSVSAGIPAPPRARRNAPSPASRSDPRDQLASPVLRGAAAPHGIGHRERGLNIRGSRRVTRDQLRPQVWSGNGGDDSVPVRPRLE
jgi:hypothetical protein